MVLISKNATWEYQLVANSTPADPSLVSVPTSSWLTNSPAPFGQGIIGFEFDQPNSDWSRGSGLWIRRNVTVDGLRDIVIEGRCHQALYLFWNGVYRGSLNPQNDEVPEISEFRVVIPRNLAYSGTHTIAILALDDIETVDPAISYISLEADYLPTFFPIQPESPVSENLSWFTDVMIHNDGTEERTKIMVSPRQRFNFSFPNNQEQINLAHNLIWGELGKRFLIAIWSQAVKVTSVSSGMNQISLDTSKSEFRSGGFAVIWKNFKDWQIVGINEVFPDSLVIGNLTRSFSSCWIMPVREAYLSKGANKNLTGFSSRFQLEFDVLDNQEISSSDPQQYQSEDVYLQETLLEGDELLEEFSTSLSIFDPEIGTQEFYNNWSSSRISRNMNIVSRDAASSWSLREFLHRRSGRYKVFWQPSFENNIKILNTGTITNTINVSHDDLIKTSISRNHIAVEADGQWFLRRIIGRSVVSSEQIVLTLDTALNIASDKVKRVSWLGLKRLDTDSVDVKYVGAGVSTCSFRITEIQT